MMFGLDHYGSWISQGSRQWSCIGDLRNMLCVRPGTQQVVCSWPLHGRTEPSPLILLDFAHAVSADGVKVHFLGCMEGRLHPPSSCEVSCSNGAAQAEYKYLIDLAEGGNDGERRATGITYSIPAVPPNGPPRLSLPKPIQRRTLSSVPSKSLVGTMGLHCTPSSVHLQSRWLDEGRFDGERTQLIHCLDFATTALVRKEPKLSARRLSTPVLTEGMLEGPSVAGARALHCSI